MRKVKRQNKVGLKWPLLIFIFTASTTAIGDERNGWWNADRGSVGIAPLPSAEPRAMVQIYVARAYGWRGHFAVHPWITVKPRGGARYTTYEVMGFGVERGIPVIRQRHDQPDRRWYGNEPELIFELRGAAAEKMIPQIEAAVASYPYPDFYRIFPGPNSNTFISHVVRYTPGISVELPPHAIGKDWIGAGDFIDLSESRTGFRVSIFGILGFTLGLAEGVEVNILGLTFGVDVLRPAIKLPFVGRLGMRDKPVFDEGSDDDGRVRLEAVGALHEQARIL